MKITATHSAVCRYDFPVYLEPHIFRLRPRITCVQRLPGFDLQIAPTPAGTSELSVRGPFTHKLSSLVASSQQVFRTCRHVTRPQGPSGPSDRRLSSLEGSCRDLAVLFCDVSRVMGIAARFVGGYECASAASQESCMHARVEVYLPGIGWRGYDPSRGIAVANGHLAVAAGCDHDLESSLARWCSGRSGSRMEASLSLQVADAA